MNSAIQSNKSFIVVGVLLIFLLGIASSIVHELLMPFAAISLLTVLIYFKKMTAFIVLLPFISLALIPSGYVSLFRIPTPIGELRVSFVIILVCLLLVPLLGRLKIDVKDVKRSRALIALFFIFFGINIVSALTNNLGMDTIQYSFFTFVYSLGAFVFILLIGNLINVRKILKTVLAVSTFVSVLGIVELFGFQPYAQFYLIDNEWFNYINTAISGLPRIVSTMGNPLILAAFLLLCLPFLFYFREQQKNKGMVNLLLFIHVVAIVLTQSRSAIIIMAVLILWLSVQNLRKFVKNTFMLGVALAGAYGLLSLFGLSQAFFDRLLFRTESESISIRSGAFEVAFSMLNKSNFWFGIGPNKVNEQLASNTFTSISTLDNLFLMTLVSLGFFGLLTLVTILLVLFYKFSRMRKDFRQVGYSLLIVFVGMSFSFNLIFFESVWSTFWILVGLLIVMDRKYGKEVLEQTA